MHRTQFRVLALALWLGLPGCELIAKFDRDKIETRTTRPPGQSPIPVPQEPDGGFPQVMDAAVDGGDLDASSDAALPDGSALDAGGDAGADAATDAATDAGSDAAVDAGADADVADAQVSDAAVDAG
jgi:hypothetical protein